MHLVTTMSQAHHFLEYGSHEPNVAHFLDKIPDFCALLWYNIVIEYQIGDYTAYAYLCYDIAIDTKTQM